MTHSWIFLYRYVFVFIYGISCGSISSFEAVRIVNDAVVGSWSGFVNLIVGPNCFLCGHFLWIRRLLCLFSHESLPREATDFPDVQMDRHSSVVSTEPVADTWTLYRLIIVLRHLSSASVTAAAFTVVFLLGTISRHRWRNLDANVLPADEVALLIDGHRDFDESSKVGLKVT